MPFAQIVKIKKIIYKPWQIISLLRILNFKYHSNLCKKKLLRKYNRLRLNTKVKFRSSILNLHLLILSLQLNFLILFLNLNLLILPLKLNPLISSLKLNPLIPSLQLNPLILSLKQNSLNPCVVKLNPLIPSLKLKLLILSLKLKLLILFLNLNSLTMRYLPKLLKNSCFTPSALQRRRRSNSCLNFSATRDSLLICCIVDQSMGGSAQTSTVGVITRERQSPCLRSKTVTASAATPRLSGHLMTHLSMLVIVMRCCSTCLAKGTSQTKGQTIR